MRIFLLISLTIIIPLLGAILSLFFSRSDVSLSDEVNLGDWVLFVLIFIPTAFISVLLLRYMNSNSSILVRWLPGFQFGLRLTPLTAIVGAMVACLSTVIAFYSISYLKFDQNKTTYWFFYLLSLSGMMLGIFSDNILWLFGGFELATIGGFFLVSHFHRKSTEDGEKAAKAAVRYLLINAIADTLLIIGLALLYFAFGQTTFPALHAAWSKAPINIIGSSAQATRQTITLLLAIGGIIKTGQIPFLLWSLVGKEHGTDLSKAPLTVTALLLTTTVSVSGLYYLQVFFPFFTGLAAAGEPLPAYATPVFLTILWLAIGAILFSLSLIAFADNMNRLLVGLTSAQMGFALLSLGAGNTTGYVGSIFHFLMAAPASIALIILFGMVYETIRVRSLSRLGGVKEYSKPLFIMGIIATLAFGGVFPGSTFFSKDMIFGALLQSTIPSHIAVVVLAVLCSLILTFLVGKTFMKAFFGAMDEVLSVRKVSILSLIAEGASLAWSVFAGLFCILIVVPTPNFAKALAGESVALGYAFPIFSDWILSPIVLCLQLLVFAGVFFAYKDGSGELFAPFRTPLFEKIVRRPAQNALFSDLVVENAFLKPLGFVGKFLSITRIKAPYASILWAVVATILLIALVAFVGGL